MNTKKVKQIIDLFQKADGVKIDDGPAITAWSTYTEIGVDPENQVLNLSWTDSEDRDFSVIFTEAGLAGATLEYGKLIMDDHEGEPCLVELLEFKPMLEGVKLVDDN